jgi:DNA-directed RNA polymerase specialized sigma24 family protein
LQLHYSDGFTYEEIGQVMGMSSEAVRKRVARSVEKFRQVYEEKKFSTKL